MFRPPIQFDLRSVAPTVLFTVPHDPEGRSAPGAPQSATCADERKKRHFCRPRERMCVSKKAVLCSAPILYHMINYIFLYEFIRLSFFCSCRTAASTATNRNSISLSCLSACRIYTPIPSRLQTVSRIDGTYGRTNQRLCSSFALPFLPLTPDNPVQFALSFRVRSHRRLIIYDPLFLIF